MPSEDYQEFEKLVTIGDQESQAIVEVLLNENDQK